MYGCNYVDTSLDFQFFLSSLQTQFLEDENKMKNKTYLTETLKAVLSFLLRFIRSTLLCACQILQVSTFYYSEGSRMISCI